MLYVADRYRSFWIYCRRGRHAGADAPGDRMSARAHVIKREPVPRRGSYEVRFSDGRPSKHFYWDDVPDRRLGSDQLTSEEAGKQARAFAQAERDKAL